MHITHKLARVLALILVLLTPVSGPAGLLLDGLLLQRPSVAQAQGFPDFQPVSISVPMPKGMLLLGETYTGTFTVTNNGSVPASGYWSDQLYLSSAPYYVAGDRFLGAVPGPGSLASGASYTHSITFPMPSAAPGGWYLVSRVNAGGDIDESTRTNNLFALPVSVAYPPDAGPDLAVTDISLPAGPLLTGAQIEVGFTVTNIGNRPATVPWADGLYLSQDQTFSNNDILLVGGVHGGSDLAPDASYQQSWSITVPDSSAGPWYLLAITDQLSERREQSELNNLRVLAVDIQSWQTPTPTVTLTPLPAATPTETLVPTATATWTATATETATSTDTPMPTTTATETPVPTATTTATATATETPLPTATATVTVVPTNTATLAPTNTLTPLPTPTASATPTLVELPESEPTPTHTPLPKVTETPVPTATSTRTPLPATTTPTRIPVLPTAARTPVSATATPTRTPLPATATPTRTPTQTATPTAPPASTNGADGWISGGGFIRERDQGAAIAFALSCDDDRRPARLELLWRNPSNRDPRDHNDRRPDWDWDDHHWNNRAWNIHEWNDRDWDDHEWDDRDWYNWGRDRRNHRRRDNDPDERRGGWGRFHLTSITSATCTNDPAISSNGRKLTFDTHTGTGRGRLADSSTATIEWTLVDGGEPGRRDRISVKVRNDRGQVLFEMSDSLSAGRIKAHRR